MGWLRKFTEQNKINLMLNVRIDDESLSYLGFNDYDDEHCVWGNRRLHMPNSVLQIIEYGDFPENEGRSERFYYEGWFVHPWNGMQRNDESIELKQIKDIYYIVEKYHGSDLECFKNLILNGKIKYHE